MTLSHLFSCVRTDVEDCENPKKRNGSSRFSSLNASFRSLRDGFGRRNNGRINFFESRRNVATNRENILLRSNSFYSVNLSGGGFESKRLPSATLNAPQDSAVKPEFSRFNSRTKSLSHVNKPYTGILAARDAFPSAGIATSAASFKHLNKSGTFAPHPSFFRSGSQSIRRNFKYGNYGSRRNSEVIISRPPKLQMRFGTRMISRVKFDQLKVFSREFDVTEPSASPFRRQDICAICQLPVFLAERLKIGAKLLHRTCFRCARCKAQLTPSACYETENNEYCCEVCPDEEKSLCSSVRSLSPVSTGLASLTSVERISEKTDLSPVPTTSKSSTEVENMASESSFVGPVDDDTRVETRIRERGPSRVQSLISRFSTEARSSFLAKELSYSETTGQSSVLPVELDVQPEPVVGTIAEEEKEDIELVAGDGVLLSDENEASHVSDCLLVEESVNDIFISQRNVVRDGDAGLGDSVVNVSSDSVSVDASDKNSDFVHNMHSDFNDLSAQSEEKNAFPADGPSDAIPLDSHHAIDLPLDPPLGGETVVASPRDGHLSIDPPLDSQSPPIGGETVVSSPLDFHELDILPMDGHFVGIPSTLVNGEAVVEESVSESDEGHPEEVALSLPIPSPRRRDKTKTAILEYPEDLNPFDDDIVDVKQEDSEESSPARPEASDSLNPFGDDDDLDETNPFACDDSEVPPKSPVPVPRKSLMSSDQSNQSFVRSPSPSYSMRSSVTSSGKKRLAPPPPGSLQFDSRPVSPVSTISRYRKDKRAPPPPKVEDETNLEVENIEKRPLPDLVSMNEHRRNSTEPDVVSDESCWKSDEIYRKSEFESGDSTKLDGTFVVCHKNEKDKMNENRKSSSSDSSSSRKYEAPNKDSYGQWKRKKAPAPPRPLPQKRQLRKLPMRQIQQELNDLEIQQSEMERQGVALERQIRAITETTIDVIDDNSSQSLKMEAEDLILQLFDIVNEKNELLRRQTELMYLKRQQRLEEEYVELEYQIRCLLDKSDNSRTNEDRKREEELIQRLVLVVERRAEIVDCLELERRRGEEEDTSIKCHLEAYNLKHEPSASSSPEAPESKPSKIKFKSPAKLLMKVAEHKKKTKAEGELHTEKRTKSKWFKK